jgi:uncharacterized protein (TIGR03086 family)
MSADLIPGPDSPPTDELASAEATLRVLQQVVHPIATDDLTKQTACSEYDVAALTDHLLRSIKLLGEAAGAAIPEGEPDASVERQLIAAARPALDAWHRRGLDGTVPFGPNEAPATFMASIFSLEFLVHAWDYAQAVGRDVEVPDSLAEYVLAKVSRIITPESRAQVGFDEPVSVPDAAAALDRLVAFTGRRPGPG